MNDDRRKPLPNALKHGAYSALTVLPGEDADEFKKLHEELVASYKPDDPLERRNVTQIAHCLWRVQNLATYHLATAARARVDRIKAELIPRQRTEPTFSLGPVEIPVGKPPTPEEIRAGEAAAKGQIQNELGVFAELATMSDDLTLENLREELSVIERIDGMIDRCLKRLLFVKGLKSLVASASNPAPPRPETKRLTAA